MKKAYTKPCASLIDYSYEEQVVAESSKYSGLGDGYIVNVCTWQSGLFANPCDSVLSHANHDADPNRCTETRPWSLR